MAITDGPKGMPSAAKATHACSSCHTRKRGCDRLLPSCTTCLKYASLSSHAERLTDDRSASRTCSYTNESYAPPGPGTFAPSLPTQYEILHMPQRPYFDTLEPVEVDLLSSSTARAHTLDSTEHRQQVMDSYLSGPHIRFPLLSQKISSIELITPCSSSCSFHGSLMPPWYHFSTFDS
jgi:hypothetical protein